MNFVLILANSADPDEMQLYAAFHLGLHCLPEYLFREFPYTIGLKPMLTYTVIYPVGVEIYFLVRASFFIYTLFI